MHTVVHTIRIVALILPDVLPINQTMIKFANLSQIDVLCLTVQDASNSVSAKPISWNSLVLRKEYLIPTTSIVFGMENLVKMQIPVLNYLELIYLMLNAGIKFHLAQSGRMEDVRSVEKNVLIIWWKFSVFGMNQKVRHVFGIVLSKNVKTRLARIFLII